jgi:hypothetical protein
MAHTTDLQEDTKLAEEAVKVAASGIPERELTDTEIMALTDFVCEFSQTMSGIELYPYEREFSWRIIYSLLSEDSDEITALFSRQSGKTETVAGTVCGLMVILPVLAKALKYDERISKFKDGVWIGIYGPNYEQAGIMWSRAKLRMYSKSSKVALLDPDINIDLSNKTENLTLPNGSFVDCGTASPQASIEGKTYHLIILEECQDISSSKIRSSIHPMAAATAGSLVKIGTCNKKKSDFYQACRRNKRYDVSKGLARSKKRTHFEFDYTVAQRYNPKYRKYVEKEKRRLGEDSDDFKMKYRLVWLLSRGMFVNPDIWDECGVKDSNSHLEIKKGKGRYIRKVVFTRSPNVVTYDPTTQGLVAAIDIGRENSTLITIAKVFWEGGVSFGKEIRYPFHIYNWLELYGDNHEAQHPEMVDFLKNYNISQAVVDATGKGDPVYSRLAFELSKFGIHVEPFIFSESSKDLGYKILNQEIATHRMSFPAGSRASRLQKWQRFVQQMYDLEKTWRGSRMVVSKPKDDPEARDDFPDSLMMLCWLINVAKDREVESADNPFLGRAARWAKAEMFKTTKAWVKRVSDPIGRRPHRPSKSGRWDS